MNENITTKIGAKFILLTEVAAAGFDPAEFCFGHCPNCKSTSSARIFTNGTEYVLVCTCCGFRARGFRGSTYFNEWADREIAALEADRSRTNLPLLKKLITSRKKVVKLLYY